MYSSYFTHICLKYSVIVTKFLRSRNWGSCDGHLVIFMSFVGTNATHGNFGSSVNARHSFVCERAAEASIGLKLVSLASSAAPSTETFLCGILCCATVLVITFPVTN